MMAWRYVTTDDVGAAEGLALDEALMRSQGRSAAPAPPVLRLYTYASHAALCGRFQHLEAEIDLEACRRTGTAYNRRPTGGGAIVMGAGQLGVAVTTRARAAERPKATLLRLSAGVVAGLAELGLQATFGGKNDLKVGGRKIAGLGLYLDDDGALLFHASVLADLDIPFMLDVLDVPATKLGEGGVDAVEARVTTVSRELDSPWTGEMLREAVAFGFAEALGVELRSAMPTADELRVADALVGDKYSADDWLHARSPQADAMATSLLKTPAGLVRIHLALQADTIKSVLFTGDFNTIPDQIVAYENELKWARLSADAVAAAAAAAFEDGTGLDVDAAVIAEATLAAGARARERELVAAPTRDGSCYFPEGEVTP